MSMLRSIREKKGLTVSQLAARASISSRTIGEYEEGRQSIPLPHAKLLAKALWVPIEDLMPPPGAVTTPHHNADPISAQQQAPPQASPVEAVNVIPPVKRAENPGMTNGGHAVQASLSESVLQSEPYNKGTTPDASATNSLHKPARAARAPRAATPVTDGQLQELMHLATRLQITQDKLEERIGKPIAALTRPDAKEWIKKLRGMADEIAPTQKIRFGQWPEVAEDKEAAYLREERDAGAKFTFNLFNGERLTGTITDFTPYTVTIKADDGDEIVLRKLAITYYRRWAENDPTPVQQKENGVSNTEVVRDGQPNSSPDSSAEHNHKRDDHHQPLADLIDSNHVGAPDVPEEDNMDEDRGA